MVAVLSERSRTWNVTDIAVDRLSTPDGQLVKADRVMTTCAELPGREETCRNADAPNARAPTAATAAVSYNSRTKDCDMQFTTEGSKGSRLDPKTIDRLLAEALDDFDAPLHYSARACASERVEHAGVTTDSTVATCDSGMRQLNMDGGCPRPLGQKTEESKKKAELGTDGGNLRLSPRTPAESEAEAARERKSKMYVQPAIPLGTESEPPCPYSTYIMSGTECKAELGTDGGNLRLSPRTPAESEAEAARERKSKMYVQPAIPPGTESEPPCPYSTYILSANNSVPDMKVISDQQFSEWAASISFDIMCPVVRARALVTPARDFENVHPNPDFPEHDLLMPDITTRAVAKGIATYEAMTVKLRRQAKRPKQPGGHWWKLVAALIAYMVLRWV